MNLQENRDSYVASVGGAKRTDSVGELYLVKVNVHQTLKSPPPSPRVPEACLRASIELTPFTKLLSHYAGSRLS